MNREQYVNEVREEVEALQAEFLKEAPDLTASQVWSILQVVDRLKNTIRVTWEDKRP